MQADKSLGCRSKGPGEWILMCSRKVVLHNAQIDKTVMIRLRLSTTRTVLLWGIASHLEGGLMQADKPGLGLKSPGSEF
jgi:hypothetical protein